MACDSITQHTCYYGVKTEQNGLYLIACRTTSLLCSPGIIAVNRFELFSSKHDTSKSCVIPKSPLSNMLSAVTTVARRSSKRGAIWPRGEYPILLLVATIGLGPTTGTDNGTARRTEWQVPFQSISTSIDCVSANIAKAPKCLRVFVGLARLLPRDLLTRSIASFTC